MPCVCMPQDPMSSFADKLKVAGIPVQTYTGPKMPHDAGLFAGQNVKRSNRNGAPFSHP